MYEFNRLRLRPIAPDARAPGAWARIWLGASALAASFGLAAEQLSYTIEIRQHLFYPAEFQIPPGTKVKLIVINKDPTPEEFESYELNREKVIMGGAKAIIFIGPLKAGRYPFFGEFNPKTAQGVITVGAP